MGEVRTPDGEVAAPNAFAVTFDFGCVRHFVELIGSGGPSPRRWEVAVEIDPRQSGGRDTHIGDVWADQVDLRTPPTLLEALALGQWAPTWFDEAMPDPASGRLHPELEDRVQPGPPSLLMLRRVSLSREWRGHRLAAPLLAGALRALADAGLARAAIAHIAPIHCMEVNRNYPFEITDIPTAAKVVDRLTSVLTSLGFTDWQGTLIADLTNPQLLDTVRQLPSALLDSQASPPLK